MVTGTVRPEDQRMRALSKRGQYWAKIVAEQAASQQGIRAFCRQRQVQEASFYAWRRELRFRQALPADDGSSSGPRGPRSAGFVAVVPAPTPEAVGSGVTLALAGGLRIELAPGFDRATLAAVLAIVGEAGGCWR
jgi:hypothetical protein